MIRIIAIFLGFLCLVPPMAAAQDQTPGFNVPPPLIARDQIEDLTVNFDDAFNTIENPYLSDTFKLNYQISLLEKMAARQSELLKISESYDSLGIEFNEPPPSRGICAQLPANAPCLKFYPELYPDLVAKRTAYYEALLAEQNKATELEIREGESKEQAIARQRAEKAAEEEKRRKKLAAEERRTRYLWTDVTCLGGQCEGMIVATRAQGFRASVKRGTKLPDGTVVKNVNTRGIVVIIDGERIALRPAPAETAETAAGGFSAFDAALGISGDNAGSFGTNDSGQSGSVTNVSAGSGATNTGGSSAGANGATATATSSGATGNSATASNAGGDSGTGGQTVVEPVLGPSGLF